MGLGRENDFVLERKLGEKFVERAEREEFAVIDDADARAEALGFLHVMRRVDDGDAGAVEELEVVEDGVARLRIDADGGFVAEEELGAVEEAGDEVEATLHASGKCIHDRMTAVGELNGDEGFVDPGLKFASAEAVKLAEDAEVLFGGEIGVECDGLGNESEGAMSEGGVGGDGLAVEGNRAGVGCAQTGRERHEGGFSGAVGAEKAEKFAGCDVEGNIVEREERAVALADRMEREHRNGIAVERKGASAAMRPVKGRSVATAGSFWNAAKSLSRSCPGMTSFLYRQAGEAC